MHGASEAVMFGEGGGINNKRREPKQERGFPARDLLLGTMRGDIGEIRKN
jgi:hypothetical protein